MNAATAGFGIYVHWPWCQSKCPYCDFNSHVRAGFDGERWARAIAAELDHFAAETPGREVTSIFFGGGTPSLMPPEATAAILARVARNWPVAPGFEVTLEANPGSVEAGRFAGYAAAGVNRVSLGVQALNDDDLRFLGRRHSTAEALAALDTAARQFERWSFDLIYARPGQTVDAWARELEQALALGSSHLSVYQLTIEQGTAFHTAHARGELVLPDEETQAALYEATQARLEAAGLPAYEISNHARPGQESRHNLTYWRYGDYVGVGPGAHGRLTLGGRKLATRIHRAPEIWLDRVEAQGHAEGEREPVGADQRRDEMAMMGLRLTAGIARERFRAELGAEPEALFDAAALARLTAGGFLELDGQGLRATAAGRQRLNAVLGILLA